VTPSHEVDGDELSCRAFQATWNIKELVPAVAVLVCASHFSRTTIVSICINFAMIEFCLNHSSSGATCLLNTHQSCLFFKADLLLLIYHLFEHKKTRNYAYGVFF